MAELTVADKLQPSLLDRLRDDAPQDRFESRDKRVMSMRHLREAVLRDLGFLLNAPCQRVDDEVHEFPLVARSVVNFGMPDLTGLTVSGLSNGRLEQMVYEAVAAFEPRIMKRTLQVRAVQVGEDGAGYRVGFEIIGDLCPLPMPEALYLKTEVDLETGKVEVKAQ